MRTSKEHTVNCKNNILWLVWELFFFIPLVHNWKKNSFIDSNTNILPKSKQIFLDIKSFILWPVQQTISCLPQLDPVPVISMDTAKEPEGAEWAYHSYHFSDNGRHIKDDPVNSTNAIVCPISHYAFHTICKGQMFPSCNYVLTLPTLGDPPTSLNARPL